MQLIKLHNKFKNKKNIIFFSNNEIKLILQLYSIQVANGIFKDYAIDNISKQAIFSFYKHTYDKPLFQIEKTVQKKNNYTPEFTVKFKKQIVDKNKSLNILINKLNKKFNTLKLKKIS